MVLVVEPLADGAIVWSQPKSELWSFSNSTDGSDCVPVSIRVVPFSSFSALEHLECS
jgi:hypothetical protein